MVTTGKVISICGVTFSGKTTLLLRLLHIFPELYTINFESIIDFNRSSSSNYKALYKKLDGLKADGIDVITECVRQLHYKSDLFIYVLPDYKRHTANADAFRAKYGSKNTYFRTAGVNVWNMRKSMVIHDEKNLFHYNSDKDFEKLVIRIKNVLGT